jgi:hypothetical protein
LAIQRGHQIGRDEGHRAFDDFSVDVQNDPVGVVQDRSDHPSSPKLPPPEPVHDYESRSARPAEEQHLCVDPFAQSVDPPALSRA